MKHQDYSRLRIYASTTDKIGSRLLYEHIVHLAKEKGISGVTVLRGIMGFGTSSKDISTSRFWELTEKLPVVIEIIDRNEVLDLFYREIEENLLSMKKGCLVTHEPLTLKLLKTGNGAK